MSVQWVDEMPEPRAMLGCPIAEQIAYDEAEIDQMLAEWRMFRRAIGFCWSIGAGIILLMWLLL